eukprot:1990732-Rhodomonas_salina.1
MEYWEEQKGNIPQWVSRLYRPTRALGDARFRCAVLMSSVADSGGGCDDTVQCAASVLMLRGVDAGCGVRVQCTVLRMLSVLAASVLCAVLMLSAVDSDGDCDGVVQCAVLMLGGVDVGCAMGHGQGRGLHARGHAQAHEAPLDIASRTIVERANRRS